MIVGVVGNRMDNTTMFYNSIFDPLWSHGRGAPAPFIGLPHCLIWFSTMFILVLFRDADLAAMTPVVALRPIFYTAPFPVCADLLAVLV